MPHPSDSTHDGPTVKKKTFEAPKLTCFGSVRSFTQGGSSGPNENSAMKPDEMTASDRRLKENVVRVGSHPLGFGLYLFDYLPERRAELGHGRQFGVMADEVEALLPDAVATRADGFKTVDYARLGIRRAAS